MEAHQRHTQPRGVRLEHVLHGEVQDLLDQLARAIADGDGEAVAALWDTPGIVIASSTVVAIQRRAQLAAMYKAPAARSSRADLLDLERIGDRIVIAAVRWPGLDESADYTLRRDDAGKLKIRSVLMRGK